MKYKNAGYEITNHINLGSDHFVLGYNPKAPAPYVTWKTDQNQDSFIYGHYFSRKEDALLDLVKRAGEELTFDGKSIGLALLTQEDHAFLREESEKEAVLFALEDIFSYPDVEYDYDSLINDPKFMDLAIHRYNNIDHSYENEAFQQSLEDLFDDFPQHKKRVIDPVFQCKISPEMSDLLQDLMSISSAKIPEKYGPWGDNIQIDCPLSNGLYAAFEIIPCYVPWDQNKLSPTNPPNLRLSVLDAEGNSLSHASFSIRPDENNKTDVLGAYEIYADGKLLTIVLEEEESLRRTGCQFVFRNSGEDLRYREHDGEACTISRALTPKECDILCSGLMWEAKFPNGDVLHVFDCELESTSPELNHKPSLSQQIDLAKQRTEGTSSQQLNPSMDR